MPPKSQNGIHTKEVSQRDPVSTRSKAQENKKSKAIPSGMGSCVWVNRQHRSVGWSCGIRAFVCQQIAWLAVVVSGIRPGFKLTCIVHKYRCRAVSLSSRQVVVGVLPILLVHYFVIIAEFVATVWLMFWQCCWSIFL